MPETTKATAPSDKKDDNLTATLPKSLADSSTTAQQQAAPTKKAYSLKLKKGAVVLLGAINGTRLTIRKDIAIAVDSINPENPGGMLEVCCKGDTGLKFGEASVADESLFVPLGKPELVELNVTD